MNANRLNDYFINSQVYYKIVKPIYSISNAIYEKFKGLILNIFHQLSISYQNSPTKNKNSITDISQEVQQFSSNCSNKQVITTKEMIINGNMIKIVFSFLEFHELIQCQLAKKFWAEQGRDPHLWRKIANQYQIPINDIPVDHLAADKRAIIKERLHPFPIYFGSPKQEIGYTNLLMRKICFNSKISEDKRHYLPLITEIMKRYFPKGSHAVIFCEKENSTFYILKTHENKVTQFKNPGGLDLNRHKEILKNYEIEINILFLSEIVKREEPLQG